MNEKELKIFVFVSIISADNDNHTEDEKQAVLTRYNETKDNPNWKYILEPIKDKNYREKYIKILQN